MNKLSFFIREATVLDSHDDKDSFFAATAIDLAVADAVHAQECGFGTDPFTTVVEQITGFANTMDEDGLTVVAKILDIVVKKAFDNLSS